MNSKLAHQNKPNFRFCFTKKCPSQEFNTMTLAAGMATRAATGTERRARPAKGLKKSME